MESNITANNAPKKFDRKTIERNRRLHMKGLISELTSLVPPQHFKPSKEMLSQPDQLDQVVAYIKQLRARLEELKKRKSNCDRSMTNIGNSAMPESRIPVVKITEFDSSLEVVLVSGIVKNFALHEVIKVLEEEGVEVVSISISTVDKNIYHILHAQVKVSRFGVDTSMIYDRLQTLFKY